MKIRKKKGSSEMDKFLLYQQLYTWYGNFLPKTDFLAKFILGLNLIYWKKIFVFFFLEKATVTQKYQELFGGRRFTNKWDNCTWKGKITFLCLSGIIDKDIWLKISFLSMPIYFFISKTINRFEFQGQKVRLSENFL